MIVTCLYFMSTDVVLTRTADIDKFKQQINSLSASGGGDFPEMCLSGLLVCVHSSFIMYILYYEFF